MLTQSNYLSVSDLIVYLGVSRSTISNWRRDNTGPPYARIGKRIFYQQQAVDKFINDNIIGDTNEKHTSN